MWINQPSTTQLLHKHHGRKVLACYENAQGWRVFFLEGPVESMQVSPDRLSPGWPAEEPQDRAEIRKELREQVKLVHATMQKVAAQCLVPPLAPERMLEFASQLEDVAGFYRKLAFTMSKSPAGG
jgi:hypothetical protein